MRSHQRIILNFSYLCQSMVTAACLRSPTPRNQRALRSRNMPRVDLGSTSLPLVKEGAHPHSHVSVSAPRQSHAMPPHSFDAIGQSLLQHQSVRFSNLKLIHARFSSLPLAMSRHSSSATTRSLSEPRPSSSVLIVSPANEVLLLHRVQTSTSFASAHVFPGGNLDPFHDGVIPAADSPERHRESLAYRIGAIRETFEETGIILAKKDGNLIDLPVEDRDTARKAIHGNHTKFLDWLASVGAEPDLSQ